ncbi:Flp pilus assembly protein CpaB [Bacillus sp. PS06]|uniref:Flp pilus assembly protein CpaB n=1 Tax=Bacillus sp. PS06 TaxID=2764176 RepID=UPI00177AC09B|nr:SAF domain-containing protein [Bacillus sp. PS06]MBD8071129.1 flp pilus assembly protein CpaB [Bacillus sp. PS06]
MLESKRRAAIFLLIAFVLAAAAGYLVLQKVKDLNAELGGMTRIYIANADIPARTLIQESQITTMEIPNKFVNSAHVLDKEELLNQVVVVPLADEEIITKNMIKPYSNLRNENNRLVAMYPSEKVQFDQVIEALDRVDIIVSIEDEESSLRYKTEIFMRDVPVAFAQGTNENFSGVALEVSIEDAEKLIHMQNYADQIRVLKANVGKTGDEIQIPEQEVEEEPSESEEEQPSESNETPSEEESEEEASDE